MSKTDSKSNFRWAYSTEWNVTRITYILLILLFVGCSAGIEPLEPQPDEIVRPNAYIEDLAPGLVRGDIVVQGVVTTSDEYGNFYQSLIIEDPTRALELRFSFYDTHSLFKIGEVVSVMLFDREITIENNLLSVDMGTLTLASQTVLRQGRYNIAAPMQVKIPNIDSTLVGRLVRISGGRFDNGGSTAWSGEQRYSVGEEYITIYTTPLASYANDALPYGQVAIQGILMMYKDKFQLKISSPLDVTFE